VLEDDEGDARVEPGIRQRSQCRPISMDPVHVLQARVVPPRVGQHFLGHIECVYVPAAGGQNSSQAANATPDLNHILIALELDSDISQETIHCLLSASPERLLVWRA
jgi:hypothetical protein